MVRASEQEAHYKMWIILIPRTRFFSGERVLPPVQEIQSVYSISRRQGVLRERERERERERDVLNKPRQGEKMRRGKKEGEEKESGEKDGKRKSEEKE